MSPVLLESKIVIDQNHVNTAFMPGVPRDKELAADRIRGLAVHAGSGLGARRIQAEALRIGRCRDVSGTLHGAVDIVADLIHAHDKQDLLRALRDRGYTVGITIDIDEDAVFGHRICGA